MLANFFFLCYAITMANIGNASLNDEQRKLVEENMGLVYHQAHKCGITDEDLIQEGMIGLVNAVRYFSPDFGVRFSTYASSYIWSALQGTYSDKKNKKKSAFTDSLDDPEFLTQPKASSDFFICELETNCDPLANQIIQLICEGYTKTEVRKLLEIDISKLNAILKKVRRDLYAEYCSKKENR